MQWRENEEKRETRKKGHCLECHMTLSSHVTKDKSDGLLLLLLLLFPTQS